MLGRGYNNKAVVGVVMDSPEESSISLQEYVAACIEVARGKLGTEVEILIYVNKILEDGEIKTIEAMHTTSLSSATVFSSSSDVTITRSEETGVCLQTTATGCSKCIVGFHNDLTREQHQESRSHLRNLLYSNYKRNKLEMLKNPHSLNLAVSVAASEKEEKKEGLTVRTTEAGLVEIDCKPQEEKEFKIILKNIAPSSMEELTEGGGLIVEDLGLLRGEEVVKLEDDHDLTKETAVAYKIRLKPQKRYKVHGKFTGASIGQLKVPVLVSFYHETRSEKVEDKFKLSRMVVEILFKVQDDEVRALLPRVPYQPVETPSRPWRGRETIRGRPLPKPVSNQAGTGDSLEVKLPLGSYPISGVRRRVIEGRLEKPGSSPAEKEELKKCLEVTSKDLDIENYADRWELLLHSERQQEEKDIRQFDMTGQKLKIDKLTGLLALDVPGLQEGRPSLIKGDKLFLTHDEEKEYEGYVHTVGKTRVFLGFSNQIIPRVKDEGIYWSVRFHVSTYSWNHMHRAVKLCQQSNLSKLLFPVAADLPLGGRTDVVLRYYDDQVKDNPEQREAVTAIVTGRSGRVPYLVFGPPGTGKTVTLVEAIRQVWRLNGETHILACAPSNTAADLLAVRLRRGGHIPDDQIMRLNALSRSEATIPDSLRPCTNVTAAGQYIPPMAVLCKKRIIVCTLVMAGKLASAVFPQVKYYHYLLFQNRQCLCAGSFQARLHR